MEFRKLQILVELDLSSCSQLGCLPIHIFPALQVAVQEAGGCLTTKMPLQWEAVGLQGEAVFVDFFSLLVTFSYFFLLFVTFINYFLLGQEGQGKPFISFIHCSGGRGHALIFFYTRPGGPGEAF
jgi:hypothetical protein